MISDLSGLDLSILHVHLVATQYYGYTITHMLQITMPDGYIIIRHSGRDIKHDDGTLGLDVVAVSESSKLLLAGSVPHVESDWSPGRVEDQRVNLNTNGSCVDVYTS